MNVVVSMSERSVTDIGILFVRNCGIPWTVLYGLYECGIVYGGAMVNPTLCTCHIVPSGTIHHFQLITMHHWATSNPTIQFWECSVLKCMFCTIAIV